MVSQPVYKLGEAAGTILVQRIKGTTAQVAGSGGERNVASRLIRRGSVGPVQARSAGTEVGTSGGSHRRR